MVSAVGTSTSTATGAGSSVSSQIAALQRQLTALQKQLTQLQKGDSTQDTQMQEDLLSRQIAMIQAEISALQAASTLKSAMQGAWPASSSRAAMDAVSASSIDTRI